MPTFTQKTLQAVHSIPKGKVASYGQIALMIGVPRAAQAVGQVLHASDTNTTSTAPIPWWRVINNAGRISTTCLEHPAIMQKQLLEKEGVVVTELAHELKVDIEKYRYRPTPDELSKLELPDEYIEAIVKKYLL